MLVRLHYLYHACALQQKVYNKLIQPCLQTQTSTLGYKYCGFSHLLNCNRCDRESNALDEIPNDICTITKSISILIFLQAVTTFCRVSFHTLVIKNVCLLEKRHTWKRKRGSKKCKISHFKSGAMELLPVYFFFSLTLWDHMTTLLQATNWFRFVDLLIPFTRTMNQNVCVEHVSRKHYNLQAILRDTFKKFRFQIPWTLPILIFVFEFKTRFGGKSHENFGILTVHINRRVCFILFYRTLPVEWEQLTLVKMDNYSRKIDVEDFN